MRVENEHAAERRSVLIIDNDRDVAEVVRAVLQDEGYQVAVLGELAPDAIYAAVGRLEPDVILLDGISEFTGYGRSWEHAAKLRARSRPVPVVMFSAQSSDITEAREGVSDRSRRAGLAGIIAKPFDIDELINVVAEAVGKAPAFDRSLAADAERSQSLANELEGVGAQDVKFSARREWVTFRAPAGRIMQIYWWQKGGSYLVGRYDDDGKRMENVALTYDRPSAVEICASLLRADQVAG